MHRWHNRKTILAEFTGSLLCESAKEELSIEWSSSDEEVPSNPRVPLVQTARPHPSSRLSRKTENEASNSKIKSSVKKRSLSPEISHAEAASIQKPSAVISKDELGTIQETTELETPHNTDFGHGIKFNKSHVKKALPLFTSFDCDKQSNRSEGREAGLLSSSSHLEFSHKSSHVSPITHCLLSQRPPNEDGVNVLEPKSPVIGLKMPVIGHCSPVIGIKNVKIEPCSPVLRSYKSAKRKLTLNNIIPVKRQIDEDDIPTRLSLVAAAAGATQVSIGKEQSNNVTLTCSRNVCNVLSRGDPSARYQPDAHLSECEECCGVARGNKDQDRLISHSNISLLHVLSRSPSGVHLSEDHLSEEIVQSSVEYQNSSNTPDSNLHPSTIRSLHLQQDAVSCGDGGNCYSQPVAVPSEEIENQSDYDIEDPFTPSACGVEIDKDNEAAGVSQHVSPTIPAQPESSTRSGFDWIKTLQTPQKPSSSENKEDGMESAKKKLTKDGQAERLRRLLASWQSSINVWSHEMSLTAVLRASPSHVGKSPVLPQKIMFLAGDTGIMKLEPQGRVDDVKPSCSPSVRNLQDLLIESPASSPVVTLSPHIHPPSRKYLVLRLIEVGGQLPSNAALCEALDSNVEELHIPIKKENFETPCEKSVQKRRYLVFFALSEHKIAVPLCKYAKVKIYSPWQKLALPAHDVPALFTSYFWFDPREGGPPDTHTDCTRIVFHTWTCDCSGNAVVSSLCSAEQHAFPWASGPLAGHSLLLNVPCGFNTIKDTPETPPKSGYKKAGTVVEALEKCGGVSAVPVTITVRIHHTCTKRNASGSVEAWDLLGQDAGGQFCVVRLPNWPLAHSLKETLGTMAGTYTLTNLTMTERLTNTQNPELFSLITSLHNAYQSSLLADSLLQKLLQDLSSRPPQTHCYLLIVNLGMTEVMHGDEQVTLPLHLPQWSLQEALTVAHNGQRGSLTVYLLYKTNTSLHVMSPVAQQGGSSILPPHRGRNAAGSSREGVETCQKTMLVSRVLLMGADLPPGMSESGAVMLSAVLKDAVVWHGNVVVDEYSSIQLHESEGCTNIDLSSLHQVLPTLSGLTKQDSLTLVSGTIAEVDEENAFIYPVCGSCRSDKVQEVEGVLVDCAGCGRKSSSPGKGYFLEVWLSCGFELHQATVKVKLYQKTIEELLLSCHGPQVEEYSSTSLLGCQVGPLVCMLLQLRRPRQCTAHTYYLDELPY